MRPRVLVVDTYYPGVVDALPVDPTSSYQVELRKILNFSFGTADYYSRHLNQLGFHALDIIANHDGLQAIWAWQNDQTGPDVLADQIQFYEPDVIFLQDLSLARRIPKGDYLIAGQCSCPLPAAEDIKRCQVLFTSFPHYVQIFAQMGVKAFYSPLAFDPIVLERVTAPRQRTLDCVFIGGVGTPSHWDYGMRVLNRVAEDIPEFKWWGYGANLLPDGPLKSKFQGPAWGVQMYDILCQSKICLNRHGEVAGSYANNMRLFECTGAGALLLTETKDNLGDLFSPSECITYRSPEEASMHVRYLLDNWESEPWIREMALKGQQKTLRNHTYKLRMANVAEVLRSML